ncbi:Hypothetical protein PBC10988_15030 [Planctomycetales bacterium 10988]|nr:Hypothetical protein PBC10988_15030 [Planctomycetales bacterium 10988]
MKNRRDWMFVGCLLCISVNLLAEEPRQSEPLPKPGELNLCPLGDREGVHHLHQIDPQLFSGAEPEGETGIATLAKLGIRTIVCVDSLPPSQAIAEKYGIKVIHIPLTYAEITEDSKSKFKAVLESQKKPIFVHCHHGKHRGPAAAAIFWQIMRKGSHEDALKILETVGTSKEYQGLWRDVSNFSPDQLKPVSADELVADASEPGFAHSMAIIDRFFLQLDKDRAADWKRTNPEEKLTSAQYALLLKEAFREGHRLLKPDVEYRHLVKESEQLCGELEEALKAKQLQKATQLFYKIEDGCISCHSDYRD